MSKALPPDQQRAVELARAAVARQRAGEFAEAARLYEQVLELVPPRAGVLANLGDAYRKLGRTAEARQALERAALLDPQLAAAHYNLALTLEELGLLREAAQAYERALERELGLTQAVVSLLRCLRASGEYQRAVTVYERWAGRVSDTPELRCAIGEVLADIFRVDEAILHFRRGLELAPESADVRAAYAAALVERGELRLAIDELRRVLELDPRRYRAHSSIVYLTALLPEATSSEIAAEARLFDQRYARELPQLVPHLNDRDSNRRLRVGYVSGDFRMHAAALFFPGLLTHHDRAAVEVYCYSSAVSADAITAVIRSESEQFREIANLSDHQAAELIASDRIDVLVDLGMHSGTGRPLLFARKPSPVQVCWLAYPGTTGLSAMDYRLSDPVLDPLELAGGAGNEKVVRLPHCYWCYAPLGSEPSVSELPALAAGHVTFASVNSFKKVTDAALALWASVLEGVPGSRMLIVAPEGLAWARVERTLGARGITSDRIERLPHAPRAEYLREFGRIDCCLDTFPNGGGTTTFEAMWMGVPVVSLLGETPAGRAGASIARCLELPELVGATPEAYRACAVELTRDLQRLARLRRELRARILRSPLGNQADFARAMEAAYREMFAAWAAGPSLPV